MSTESIANPSGIAQVFCSNGIDSSKNQPKFNSPHEIEDAYHKIHDAYIQAVHQLKVKDEENKMLAKALEDEKAEKAALLVKNADLEKKNVELNALNSGLAIAVPPGTKSNSVLDCFKKIGETLAGINSKSDEGSVGLKVGLEANVNRVTDQLMLGVTNAKFKSETRKSIYGIFSEAFNKIYTAEVKRKQQNEQDKGKQKEDESIVTPTLTNYAPRNETLQDEDAGGVAPINRAARVTVQQQATLPVFKDAKAAVASAYDPYGNMGALFLKEGTGPVVEGQGNNGNKGSTRSFIIDRRKLDVSSLGGGSRNPKKARVTMEDSRNYVSEQQRSVGGIDEDDAFKMDQEYKRRNGA